MSLSCPLLDPLIAFCLLRCSCCLYFFVIYLPLENYVAETVSSLMLIAAMVKFCERGRSSLICVVNALVLTHKSK